MRLGSRGDGYPDNREKFWEEYRRGEAGGWTQDEARLWTWANTMEWETFTGFWPLRSWPTWVIGNWMGLKNPQQRAPGRRDNTMRYGLCRFFLHNGMHPDAVRRVVLARTFDPLTGAVLQGDYNKNAIDDVDRMIEKFRRGELVYKVYDMIANKVVDNIRL